ncbi:MAG: hypothetical protein ACRDY7_12900 [Acidimicrobiia bacterium]
MRRTTVLAAALLLGGSLSATGPDTAGAGSAGRASAGRALPAGVARLAEPAAVTVTLPADPHRRLRLAVESLAARLGVALSAGPALTTADLPDAVAGRLALLTEQASSCHLAAAPARAAVSSRTHPPVAATRALRECAARLQSLAVETSVHLGAAPGAGGGGVDLWPVLRYSPGATDDRYLHDYVLIVDEGGDDTYLNNAAGNLLDLKRGPDGSPAPMKEPARGCQKAGLAGIDFPEECVPAAAVLVDAAGDDTYGALEAPDPTGDGFCTDDPLVRRLFTGGAALAGVGILLDGGGDDRYLGKTNALGAGHAAGVGILRDEAGNDSYLAFRSAQGYGLAGVGLLSDQGGDDTFGFYALGPSKPHAGYQRPGSGGVIDDRGTCDGLVRQLQGTGFVVGGYGLFLNHGGTDSYASAPPATQQSDAFMFPHGSQGFGGNGGFGYFLDEGGHDAYEGVPDRADDAVVQPDSESSGYFEDRASGTSR